MRVFFRSILSVIFPVHEMIVYKSNFLSCFCRFLKDSASLKVQMQQITHGMARMLTAEQNAKDQTASESQEIQDELRNPCMFMSPKQPSLKSIDQCFCHVRYHMEKIVLIKQ